MASKDPGAQTLFILWIAMLVSQVLLFAIGQIVPTAPDSSMSAEDLEIMAMVLTVLGVVTALASALAVPLMFRPDAPQAFMTQSILRFALAETPTLLGVVLAMLGAPMLYVYILTAVGIVAHVTAFPTDPKARA